jgi:hypothetical protein
MNGPHAGLVYDLTHHGARPCRDGAPRQCHNLMDVQEANVPSVEQDLRTSRLIDVGDGDEFRSNWPMQPSGIDAAFQHPFPIRGSSLTIICPHQK